MDRQVVYSKAEGANCRIYNLPLTPMLAKALAKCTAATAALFVAVMLDAIKRSGTNNFSVGTRSRNE